MEEGPYYLNYVDFYKSKLENDNKKQNEIHKKIDDLNIDSDNLYNSYPDYNNPNFIYEISNKLEFFHMKSLLNITDISNKCKLIGDPNKNDFQFELSTNQQFLKNFINKKTPYRGLVIFHGVGVGKTCSAINISKSFRDIYMSNKEKIICLVPKNIRGGWENTIYDKTKGNEQCSGDSFEDIIMDASNKGRISDKKIKTMIKNYYDFYGYLKFANYVKRLIKNSIGNLKLEKEEYQKREREIIKDNFSHRILIIDEIHNLREENDENNKSDMNFKIKNQSRILWEDRRGVIRYGKVLSSEGNGQDKIYKIEREDNNEIEIVPLENIKKINNEDKKARETIEKVIEYSEGLRLIMLSATPMFNKSTEILWLLNLLLKNDKRPLISYNDVFKKTFSPGQKGDLLTKKGKQIIANKSRGYFSYLRGENPISFPIRFYPDINKDPLCMGGDHYKKFPYIDYPRLSLFLKNGEHLPIKDRYEFRFMKMYNTIMGDLQSDIYESFINNIQTVKKVKTLRLSDRNIGLQLSNITYSLKKSDNFNKSYGKVGYDRFFKDKIERKRKLCTYIDSKNPILDIDNIQNISSKIHTILTNIIQNKTEGIIFIYSEYIYSGILPLALALEHIGFEKYGGNNLLNYPEWKKGSEGNSTKREPLDYQMNLMSKSKTGKRARYIVLTGDRSLSLNNEIERKASLHENNIYGENIKIILGNTVTSEGMDFKNIREVHVLDPWYHLYKIEQIIGRGIRFCSHSLQPKEKQNVTVYLHTSSIDHKIESIDTNTYRMAEEKASQIGEIEKIIKDNSIDCFLNKQINNITGLKNINMKTSQKNIVSVDINDKEYTKICSFSGNDEKTGCEINCNIEDEKWNKLLDNIKNDENIDTDTFTIDDISESIKIIYKIVKELFEQYNVYSLDEIIQRVKELIDTNIKIIYHSLESIVDNKLIVWNNDTPPISGYIIENQNYYLFQPFHNKDIYTPYIYRTRNQEIKMKDNFNYNLKLDVEIVDQITCNMNYNDIYQDLRNNINEINKKKVKDTYGKYIKDLKDSVIEDNYIDSLKYEEKEILLKEILCEYIKNKGEIKDKEIDQKIFNFFEDNLIYLDEDGGYHILDTTVGVPIGFFLYNTNEYYKNPRKEVLDDFTYFQFNIDESLWTQIDNVGINTLKQNFKTNKNKKRKFKTSKVWGYSFKDENNDPTFKVIDSATYDNKVPGKIIGNKGVKPVTLLKQFSESFKTNFDKFINDLKEKISEKMEDDEGEDFKNTLEGKDNDTIIKIILSEYRRLDLGEKDENNKKKSLITKEFIKLLFEYSLRNGFTFFKYDQFLLKYIS